MSPWRLNPYPADYRPAFACSLIPYPLPHQLALASSLSRLPGRRRAYHVPPTVTVWVRSCLSAGGASSAPGEFGAPGPDHVPFGPSLSASLACLCVTTFIGTSPGLTYHALLVPDRRDAGSRRVGSRLHGRPRDEVTLSRRLRTSPLPVTHAAVGDRWRNIRLDPDDPTRDASPNSYHHNFVSHQRFVRPDRFAPARLASASILPRHESRSGFRA